MPRARWRRPCSPPAAPSERGPPAPQGTLWEAVYHHAELYESDASAPKGLYNFRLWVRRWAAHLVDLKARVAPDEAAVLAANITSCVYNAEHYHEITGVFGERVHKQTTQFLVGWAPHPVLNHHLPLYEKAGYASTAVHPARGMGHGPRGCLSYVTWADTWEHEHEGLLRNAPFVAARDEFRAHRDSLIPAWQKKKKKKQATTQR